MVYQNVLNRGRSDNDYVDPVLLNSVPEPNILILRHYFLGFVVDDTVCHTKDATRTINELQ